MPSPSPATNPTPTRLPNPHTGRLLAWAVAALVVAAAASVVANGLPSDRPAHAPVRSLTDCTQTTTGLHDSCYERVIRTALRRDVAGGIAMVRRHAARDLGFARRCHMLMHPMGRTFGEQVELSGIPHDGKDCAAGFVHGALERKLSESGGLDRHLAAEMCGFSRTPSQRADCEHGLGHVLMRNLDNDVPGALRRCAALGDPVFRRHCASGAFMENRFAETRRDDTAATSFRLVPRVCARVSRPVRGTCAAWAARSVPAGARLAHCRGLTQRQGRSTCLLMVGALSRSARLCTADATCWAGRGYQVAQPPNVPEQECTRAPNEPTRVACATGVGLRRGTGSRTGTRGDARLHCAAIFGTRQLQRACQRGFAERLDPIDFV